MATEREPGRSPGASEEDIHPAIAQWIEHLEKLGWTALAADSGWRLVWVSSELQQFLDADDDEVGLGLHLLDVLTLRPWQNAEYDNATFEYLSRLAGYARADLERRGLSIAEVISSPLGNLVNDAEPLDYPFVDSAHFHYRDPRLSPETPAQTINGCMVPVRDGDGEVVGGIVIFFMDVRPNILSLLGRGDQAMYERMARLVEPAKHRAAILFCDLAASGQLSRRLPNLAYFRLIRELWTGIDATIARHRGIVGKHAGDGATAFFLVTDQDGSLEATAAAALRAAREIHELSSEIFRESLEQPCQMRVGVHWAGSLLMGQLVPGGRLEVTALGDEVNETSRIESSAEPGQTLVSKALVQQLSPAVATDLGLDLESLRFKLLKELPGVDPKAAEEAGNIPVMGFA